MKQVIMQDWPDQTRRDELRFIARGVSASLYDLGDGRVVKLFEPGVSDDMIAREASMSTFASAAGLAAAPALARGFIDGARGIAYPFVPGDTAMGWLRRHPARAGGMMDRIAAELATIHRVAGGSGRALKEVLETDIRYGPAPIMLQDAAVDYLRALPDRDRLVHGDFHPGNIMVGPDAITVIDWSKAAFGHPAADAVRTEMLMRFGVGPDDWLTGIWRDRVALRLMRRYVQAADGVTAADLAAWRPVVALAWLRARSAGRNRAFHRYLDRALSDVGLPVMTGA